MSDRFVIQGPEQSGFAGPWSVWDTCMSTFNGEFYTDDPVFIGFFDKTAAIHARCYADIAMDKNVTQAKTIDEMKNVLKGILPFIEGVDIDTFGWVSEPDGSAGWAVRDEMVHHIKDALKTSK